MMFLDKLFGLTPAPKKPPQGLQPRRQRDANDPLRDFSDDEVERAALSVMPERVSSRASWCGGTVKECDYELGEIEKLRIKYANHEPPRLRKAIFGWLAHFEYRVREDRKDCETQKSKREQQAYTRRCEQEQGRTRAVLDALK